jgi:Cu+-exporting ATPase
MDKTGTITLGKPVVTHTMIYRNFDETTIKQLAGSIEFGSEHPLAKAIVDWMGGLTRLEVEQFVYIPGMGVRGKINGKTYRLGKVTKVDAAIQAALLRGQTVIEMRDEVDVMAHFLIADAVKPTSADAIKTLKAMGKKIVMLTGDLKPVADTIAKEIGIDSVVAEVLPDQKDLAIQDLQKQGERVLMIGDGINDAPALTRADVGMAIGAGTDIAIDAADIVLLQSDLHQVAHALRLSKQVVINMKTNLFWAFIYNLIAIPLAAGLLYGWTNWLLNPIIAAAAMALSSVSVVLNALRLRSFR